MRAELSATSARYHSNRDDVDAWIRSKQLGDGVQRLRKLGPVTVVHRIAFPPQVRHGKLVHRWPTIRLGWPLTTQERFE